MNQDTPSLREDLVRLIGKLFEFPPPPAELSPLQFSYLIQAYSLITEMEKKVLNLKDEYADRRSNSPHDFSE